MTETALDVAHLKMEQSDAARLRFYAALADAELFLLLEGEASGDQIEPRLFPVDGQDYVLAFDTQDRLAEFAGQTVAYAALPGRIVAGLLSGQALGLGLNLEVAPSSMLLPPEALAWLVRTLDAQGPQAQEAQIIACAAPGAVPEILLEALAYRLSQSAGLAQEALLSQVTYAGGGQGHLLAILGAEERAETALARAVAEALTFSGVEAGFLDVGFFAPEADIVARLRGASLTLEIPAPAPQEIPLAPAAPGSNPDKPPRLR